METHVEWRILMGQPRPHPKEAWPHCPPNFWDFVHPRTQYENQQPNEKALSETQTLRAGCSKAETKISPRRRPFPESAGEPKFNQLEMVTTFTYKPSLVRIDAPNFELSW